VKEHNNDLVQDHQEGRKCSFPPHYIFPPRKLPHSRMLGGRKGDKSTVWDVIVGEGGCGEVREVGARGGDWEEKKERVSFAFAFLGGTYLLGRIRRLKKGIDDP
jgi:hypothetical protein